MKNIPVFLSLKNLSFTYGGKNLFTDIDCFIRPYDRICLVGQNGCGKSTLLKILSHVIEHFDGTRFEQPGLKIAILAQSVENYQNTTILEAIQEILSGKEMPADYEIDSFLDDLGLKKNQPYDSLSGGEKRKVYIASVLAQNPDVLLLDEPTNHLDIPSIYWLEQKMLSFKGGLVCISHDRRFLSQTTNKIWWIYKENIYSYEKGFSHFEDWQDTIYKREEKELANLKQSLKAETHWLAKGVTARRKRNQKRLENLKNLRLRKSQLLQSMNTQQLSIESKETYSGKIIIEAHSISKKFKDTNIIESFSTRIQRGDRIGIVGPNGAGKTTLLKMLIGELPADTGKVKLGSQLTIGYFDQHHRQLNPKKSLWDNLCETGGDHVSFGEKSMHVVGYLKRFMFQHDKVHNLVSTLSGGERNRLALAKIFTQNHNFLVLDEPTNDLDMDTLDLLQDYLSDYPGTLIIISHDRDFLDQTVNSIIVINQGQKPKEYVGGYSDLPDEEKIDYKVTTKEKKDKSKKQPSLQNTLKKQTKLSYKDQRNLDLLPQQIDALESEIKSIQEKLNDPDLYQKDPKHFDTLSQTLETHIQSKSNLEDRWLILEEKREALEEK